MKRLTYSFQKGRINVDEYDRKYEELSDRLDKIRTAQKPDRSADIKRIEEIISGGWKEIYSALDREHKQAFWRNIISEIVLEWADEKPHTKVKSVKFTK